jgi:integrase
MYRLAFAPLCKKLGKKMLASVDEDDLLAIRNQIADVDGNGRAKHPAMANQFIRVVRAAFNMAIDAKKRTGLTENPCDGIKLFPEDPRQMFLTPEQVAAMFDALREIEADTPGSANIIRLMAITGARGDEVRCMRWEHLTLADDASSWWTKPSHHTKQSKLENFPLHASAIAVLRSIPRTSDWVFPSKKSASGHQESTRKPWAKVRRSIGVKGLRPHDLRHTFISLIANAGGDLYTAGKLAGHTQMKTTQRYAHLFDKTTRAAQDRALSLVPNLPDESP